MAHTHAHTKNAQEDREGEEAENEDREDRSDNDNLEEADEEEDDDDDDDDDDGEAVALSALDTEEDPVGDGQKHPSKDQSKPILAGGPLSCFFVF